MEKKGVHFRKTAIVSHLVRAEKYLVCWSIVALSYCINPVKKAGKTDEEKDHHLTLLGVYSIHNQTTVMFWTIYNCVYNIYHYSTVQ